MLRNVLSDGAKTSEMYALAVGQFCSGGPGRREEKRCLQTLESVCDFGKGNGMEETTLERCETDKTGICIQRSEKDLGKGDDLPNNLSIQSLRFRGASSVCLASFFMEGRWRETVLLDHPSLGCSASRLPPCFHVRLSVDRERVHARTQDTHTRYGTARAHARTHARKPRGHARTARARAREHVRTQDTPARTHVCTQTRTHA